jgi:hypothetical protein
MYCNDLCHLESSVVFAELWYRTELVTLASAGSDCRCPNIKNTSRQVYMLNGLHFFCLCRMLKNTSTELVKLLTKTDVSSSSKL